ncbi:MAG TPA: hypothetical protein VF741_07005 [Candidatus Aquilonibacter sp.]
MEPVLVALAAAALIAASPSPSPAPTSTPSAPSDPCGSILSIVTRPTVTTSVCNVRGGHVLLETGYSNTITTGQGGGYTASYPQAFLRIGISNHTELAITPPSYNKSSFDGAITSGTSDMNIGAKWELGYNEKAIWGANVVVSAPTGSSAFTAGHSEYTANANWAYTISPIFSAAGTLGFNSLSGLNPDAQYQNFFAFIPTVEFTAALPGTSQLFAEYAFFSRVGPAMGGRSLFDFGYQRDFGSHVQFDVEYGIQPTVIDSQQQHYFGAGLSFMN